MNNRLALAIVNTLDVVTWVIASALIVMVIYFLIVRVPVIVKTEAACLKQGYSEYHVTWDMDSYCSNPNGSVTVKVDKLD